MRTLAWGLGLVTLAAISACGPIDAPAGQVSDEAAGPVVTFDAEHPRAVFRVEIAANAEALSGGAAPGFELSSDGVSLGDVGGGPAAVVVRARRVDGGGGTPLHLHRGRCNRPRCIGVFDVTFIRGPDAPRTLVFRWSLVAFISYDGPGFPDGATIDATVATAS